MGACGPICSIGIVIAVAIQSNLGMKFSTNLVEISGGSLIGQMIAVIVGCIIMGMGMPTVAAYIIGAILFVPSLLKLGIPELPAHFFVMYYCVLSMITPPVAMASYAAAGLAKANPTRTSLAAMELSMVSFFIPFAFVFDVALLAQSSFVWTMLGCVTLLAGTGGWAAALAGYLRGAIGSWERVLLGVASLSIILSPTGSKFWLVALIWLTLLMGWRFLHSRLSLRGRAWRTF
jgi:TRAP-type uncharacterized transport system fused permease subunit